jgi:multiple sugar transport system ATP-binding protein
MLELEDLLNRRPRQLSGGQQQRVAMGRAIIRQPAAFLMDEPLSNLDAKLRVGMRTSLQELHARLGTTTIYVTHDQVEAMTLGHRVAVMRDGRIQQVDAPQTLYDDPANLFVAAFIGSPAMNLVPATLEGDEVVFGQYRVTVPADRRLGVPDGQVIMGIRPEAFEDPVFGEAGLPQIEVKVQVIEELGADAHVFFEVDAEPVVVEQAWADDEDEDATLLIRRDRALFTARLDPRTSARIGHDIRLCLDPARLYFFSPGTGDSLVRGRVAVASAG